MVLILLALAAWLFAFGCSDDGQRPDSQVVILPESFSFMDVGINTPYSRALRQRLGRVLGDDAIQGNNTIDLEVNRESFLTDYFPKFHAINDKLNTPPRERVEHKSIKLMYRYARDRGLAFSYVEFLFSEYNLTPLLVRVHFEYDDLGIGETLAQKYGTPHRIDWDGHQPGATALYWEKNGDLLILSTIPDQLGRPTYQLNIYFADRLKELIATESALKHKTDGPDPVEKKVF